MTETTAATAIRTRVWRNGVLEKENFPFEQVSDYAAEPDTLVWADLVDPDAALVARIAEELELDPHAVEDALAHRERPKAMRYPTHLFLTAYTVVPHGDELTVGRMSAFSTRHVLITVRLGQCLDIDDVVARWDDEPQLMKYGPRALLHGLLDEIVDRYMDVAQGMDDKIEDLEDILFSEEPGIGRQVSQRCYELRRSLTHLRKAVVPMRDVVGAVTRNTSHDEQAELVPYYDDLYDHSLRVSEWIDGLRDTINSVFETNMSLADSRMNTVMKKLTSWAAIIAVPTAVTGFYGQNVPYPGFGHTWGFWVSVVAIVLIAFALYVSFKRRDWL